MPEAAPAAAPAKTTPAQTTPPPAPPTERAPSEFMGDIEADFADMDAGKIPAPRDDKGKFKPGDKPKPAAKPPEPPVEPPEKPAGEVELPEKGTDTPPEPVKPVKAADLRTAYDGLKKRVKEEYEPQLQSLKAKVQELESSKVEETGPVLEKIKTLEQENTGLKKKLALADYTEDEDYKSASDKYSNAWVKTLDAFVRLKIREPAGVDPDTGEPKFTQRLATESDLLKLSNMDESELDEARMAMFGASADRALRHIETLQELALAKHDALESAKKNVGSKAEERKVQAQQTAHRLGAVWRDSNKLLEEKFPKAFHVEQGDADDSAAHAKGFALADLKFLGVEGLKPEQIEALPASFRDTVKSGKPLSVDQRVQLDALARLKMANHDRQVARVKKAHARIAELEKSLADYEKSGPPAGHAGDGEGAVTGKDWMQQAEDELRALDKG